MKKLFVFLAILTMLLSIAACSGSQQQVASDKPQEVTQEVTQEVEQEVTQEAEQEVTQEAEKKTYRLGIILSQGGLGDLGYNDDAKKGADAAVEKYGIEYTLVEPVDLTQGETYARQLAEEGYDAIFSMEFSFKNAIRTVAAEYPETIFVVQGVYTDAIEPPENMVVEVYYNNQSNFLAGIVASFLSTDGNSIVEGTGDNPGCNVGMIMGTESTGFFRNADAYTAGAKFFNPDCNVMLDFTAGFSDTSNAKNIATNMIQNGGDVVYACTGAAGLGALAAAKELGVYAIGVDSNQDYLQPGTIVTSVVRSTGRTVLEIAKNLTEGTLKGSEIVDTVINGGVGLTDMATIAEYVTDEAKFEELKTVLKNVISGIEDGSIVPYDFYETGRYVEWVKTQTELPTYQAWLAGR